MTIHDMMTAVREAREAQRNADRMADEMAGMIVGRLRVAEVTGSTLAALKRELRDFNLQTWRWKKKP